MINKTNANALQWRKNKKRKPKKKRSINDRSAEKTHQTISSNVLNYDRQKDLPRLIPLWPDQVKDDTLGGIKKIIKKIDIALQSERRKAKTNHWSYNLTKHIGLLIAFKAEQKNMQEKTNQKS